MARVEEPATVLARDETFRADLTFPAQREPSAGGCPRRLPRRALVAAFLGWMLDSFDVMLYALVLTSLIAEFGMSTATAVSFASLTLIASAVEALDSASSPIGSVAHVRFQRASSSTQYSPRRAVSPGRWVSSRSAASFSASAWEASGPAARLSSPRRGETNTAARRWASFRARGRSGTASPRS